MFDKLVLPEKDSIERQYLITSTNQIKAETDANIRLVQAGSSIWQLVHSKLHKTLTQPGTDRDYYVVLFDQHDPGEIGEKLIEKYPKHTNKHKVNGVFCSYNDAGNDYGVMNEYPRAYSSFQVPGVDLLTGEIIYDPTFPGHPELFKDFFVKHIIVTRDIPELIQQAEYCIACQAVPEAERVISRLAHIIKSYYKPLQILPRKKFAYETAHKINDLVNNHQDIWGRIKSRLATHYKDDIPDQEKHLHDLMARVTESLDESQSKEAVLSAENEALKKNQEALIRKNQELLDKLERLQALQQENEKKSAAMKNAMIEKDVDLVNLTHDRNAFMNENTSLKHENTKLKEDNRFHKETVEKKTQESRVIANQLELKSEKLKSTELELKTNREEYAKTHADLHKKISEIQSKHDVLQEKSDKALALTTIRVRLARDLIHYLINISQDLDMASLQAHEYLEPKDERTKLSLNQLIAALPPLESARDVEGYFYSFKYYVKVLRFSWDTDKLDSMLSCFGSLDNVRFKQRFLAGYKEESAEDRLQFMLNELDRFDIIFSLPLLCSLKDIDDITISKNAVDLRAKVSNDEGLKQEIITAFKDTDKVHHFLLSHRATVLASIKKMDENEKQKIVYDDSLKTMHRGYKKFVDAQVVGVIQSAKSRFIDSDKRLTDEKINALFKYCERLDTSDELYSRWYAQAKPFLEKYNKNKKADAVKTLRSIFSALFEYSNHDTLDLYDFHLICCLEYSMVHKNPSLPWDHPFFRHISPLFRADFLTSIGNVYSKNFIKKVDAQINFAIEELNKENIFLLPPETLKDTATLLRLLTIMIGKFNKDVNISSQIMETIKLVASHVRRRHHDLLISKIPKNKKLDEASSGTTPLIEIEYGFVLILKDMLTRPEKTRVFSAKGSEDQFVTHIDAMDKETQDALAKAVMHVKLDASQSAWVHAEYFGGLLLALKNSDFSVDNKVSIQEISLFMLMWMDAYAQKIYHFTKPYDQLCWFHEKLVMLNVLVNTSFMSDCFSSTEDKARLLDIMKLTSLLAPLEKYFYLAIHSYERTQGVIKVFLKHQSLLSLKELTEEQIKTFFQDFRDASIFNQKECDFEIVGLPVYVSSKINVEIGADQISEFLEKAIDGKFTEEYAQIKEKAMKTWVIHFKEYHEARLNQPRNASQLALTKFQHIINYFRVLTPGKRTMEYLMLHANYMKGLAAQDVDLGESVREMQYHFIVEHLISAAYFSPDDRNDIDFIAQVAISNFRKKTNPLGMSESELKDDREIKKIIWTVLTLYLHSLDHQDKRYARINKIRDSKQFDPDIAPTASSSMTMVPVLRASLYDNARQIELLRGYFDSIYDRKDKETIFAKTYFTLGVRCINAPLDDGKLVWKRDVDDTVATLINEYYASFYLKSGTVRDNDKVRQITPFLSKTLMAELKDADNDKIIKAIEAEVVQMMSNNLFSLPESKRTDLIVHENHLYLMLNEYLNHARKDGQNDKEDKVIEAVLDQLARRLNKTASKPLDNPLQVKRPDF
ncbi:MAG: hypothetical protein ACHQAX_01025 [Gammaproteobacteria bacterium]